MNGWGWGVGIAMAVFGAVFLWSVEPVLAASLTSMQTLYLDQGFIGHPVSLDVLDGAINISWDAGALLKPTSLIVQVKDAPTSTVDDKELQPSIFDIQFSDPPALSTSGFQVSIKGCVNDSRTACDLYQLIDGSWQKMTTNKLSGSMQIRAAIQRWSYMRQGTASWYRYKNCHCAASVDFPKGAHVRVTSVQTGKSVVVRINDYGPERDKFPNRAIDLDAVAFADLAPRGAGLVDVTVEPVLPSDPGYVIVEPVVAKKVSSSSKKKVQAQTTHPELVSISEPAKISTQPTWAY